MSIYNNLLRDGERARERERTRKKIEFKCVVRLDISIQFRMQINIIHRKQYTISSFLTENPSSADYVSFQRFSSRSGFAAQTTTERTYEISFERANLVY